MKPRTLILRTAGTNCDGETAFAFELAGALSELLHINRLLERPRLLDQFQILAIPGGFSYGDDIAAGRILANQITHHLRDVLRHFVDTDRPVIGICNGFQVLVKTDLLPGPLGGRSGQTCTLTHNDCGRFIDRWVRLAPQTSKCIWTAGLGEAEETAGGMVVQRTASTVDDGDTIMRSAVGTIELPIAHGEGKFVPADDAVRQALWDNGQVALTYATENGSSAGGRFPDNPNGSVDDIAGVCDASGLVFGLMPHPERHVDPLQHPAWTRSTWTRAGKALPSQGEGLRVFANAIRHVQMGVGAGV